MGGRWFGPEVVEPLGGETAYQAHGVMTRFFQDELTDRHYLGLTAEFGTHSAPRVLGALRAENRAHHFGRPGEPSYRWAKRWVMEAFCPSDRRLAQGRPAAGPGPDRSLHREAA